MQAPRGARVMASNVDWKGVVRELRLLATQLQAPRFYALYALAVLIVAGYLFERLWR